MNPILKSSLLASQSDDIRHIRDSWIRSKMWWKGNLVPKTTSFIAPLQEPTSNGSIPAPVFGVFCCFPATIVAIWAATVRYRLLRQRAPKKATGCSNAATSSRSEAVYILQLHKKETLSKLFTHRIDHCTASGASFILGYKLQNHWKYAQSPRKPFE